MLNLSANSRQSHTDPWSLERLLYERAIAMGMALEASSISSHNSHLNSYLTFCRIHNRPLNLQWILYHSTRFSPLLSYNPIL